MYTLLHNVGLCKGLLAEAPSLMLSILFAELFYKFHSFTLECVAFLATWYVVSYLFSTLRGFLSAKHDSPV